MFCKQCGFCHGEHANFCPICGYKVSEQDRQQLSSEQHPALWLKILFGTILLGLTISFFLILYADNMTEVVSDQLEAIKQNQLTKAYYDYTSKTFQKATSLEDFRQFFLTYPFFSHYQSVRFVDRDNTPHQGYLRAMMMTDQGVEIPLDFILSNEGDKWLIDHIKFDDPLAEGVQNKPEHAADFDDTPLRSAINNLMEQIKQHNLTNAYQKFTSQDFQKTTSFKDFEAFVKENTDFSNYQSLDLNELTFDNNIATMKGILKGPSGKPFEIEFDLIEENETWKVFHLQIFHTDNNQVSELEISKFVLGDELDGKSLIKMPKNIFKDHFKEIYLNLYLTHAKPGASVEVQFEHTDTGSTIAPVSKVVSDEGEVILTFVFSPPDAGWPKGSYRLVATSSNGKNGSYNFKLER